MTERREDEPIGSDATPGGHGEPATAGARGTGGAEPATRPAGLGPRPWLERIGLAAVAAVMGALFALVAVAAGSGGEWILAAMSAVGALMTLGVGLSTLLRG